MKKITVLLICAFLLSSCTLEQFFLLPVPTPTLLPTTTNTATHAPTMTPITPTLTFTLTPTLIGQFTETLTPELTVTPSVDPLILVTPMTPTSTVEMTGFLSVSVSGQGFYKGQDCSSNSIRFTAQSTDKTDTAWVALFVRLKSKQSGMKSVWTSIKIPSAGTGMFTYELFGDKIKNANLYHNAWVQYQFVAYNLYDAEIGRTGIFSESLTLFDCIPTPTSTSSHTPTVLRP